MKHLLSATFVALFTLSAFAQQGITKVMLTVKDSTGKPMGNHLVEFKETKTGEQILLETNAGGQLQVELKTGRFWQINIDDIRDYWSWQIDNEPKKITTYQRTITYHYARFIRESLPVPDRNSVNLTGEAQKVPVNAAAEEKLAIVNVKVTHKDKVTPLRNYPIALVSFDQKKIYTTTTNPAGNATFKVPPGYHYKIDVGEALNFDFLDIGAYKYYKLNKHIIFEPTEIKEITKGDTIIQQLPKGQSGTSARASVWITADKVGGDVWRQIPVYIRVMDDPDSTIYKGITNMNGQVQFLLPKGKKYLISFPKQKNVSILDYTRIRGIAYEYQNITYRPYEPKPKIASDIDPTLKDEIDKLDTKAKMDDQASPDDLISFLSGEGVTVTDLKVKEYVEKGKKWGLADDPEELNGYKRVLVMTTGLAINALGPNYTGAESFGHSYDFVKDETINGLNEDDGLLYDACVIEFDVVPAGKQLTLDFLFASEEYPEWLNYYDLAGVFIAPAGTDDYKNIAKLPYSGYKGSKSLKELEAYREQVSVKTVNHTKNQPMYVANDGSNKAMFRTWQYDGFTIPLQASTYVEPGKKYHVKLVIADYGDPWYDSAIFIKQNSLISK